MKKSLPSIHFHELLNEDASFRPTPYASLELLKDAFENIKLDISGIEHAIEILTDVLDEPLSDITRMQIIGTKELLQHLSKAAILIKPNAANVLRSYAEEKQRRETPVTQPKIRPVKKLRSGI
jgi:hypothetical protein